MVIEAASTWMTNREGSPMRVDSISDLLALIGQLPDPDQQRARERVAAAIEQPALQARAELGMLALDLVGQASIGQVLTLPATAEPVAASA